MTPPSTTHLDLIREAVAEHEGIEVTCEKAELTFRKSHSFLVKVRRRHSITVYLNERGYFTEASAGGSFYKATSHRGYRASTDRQVFDLLLRDLRKGHGSTWRLVAA